MKSVVLLIILLQITFPQFNEVTSLTFGDAQFLLAADLDGNGTQEILIWNSEALEVICYDYKGSSLWTLQTDYPILTAAAEELDGSNQKKVFMLEDVPEEVFPTYRIIQVEYDGTISWRKLIEVNVPDEFHFHFIDADGKPGKEIVVANRIIKDGGLERLAFQRDRLIVATHVFGGSPYFLASAPDLSYELYTFDTDPLWQGQPCAISETDASTEMLLCTLFFEAGICSCLEEWTITASTPLMKSVYLWSDITGDDVEEAVFYTDTKVQLINCQGTTLSTWESPDTIVDLRILDMTGDTCSEIAVMTHLKGSHVPSLFVLDCTGEIQSVFAFNIRGTPTVVFTDIDSDTDVDIITFSQGKRSILQIYTNTSIKGLLDDMESGTSLEVVDPSSFAAKFWTFWAVYRIAVVGCLALVGILIIAKYKYKKF
ncbi:MAG: hypothetical protein HXS44_12500 [Theionarchaea archaeon]|nr:hypothetical protein [Theionarchaea archaeon]